MLSRYPDSFHCMNCWGKTIWNWAVLNVFWQALITSRFVLKRLLSTLFSNFESNVTISHFSVQKCPNLHSCLQIKRHLFFLFFKKTVNRLALRFYANGSYFLTSVINCYTFLVGRFSRNRVDQVDFQLDNARVFLMAQEGKASTSTPSSCVPLFTHYPIKEKELLLTTVPPSINHKT